MDFNKGDPNAKEGVAQRDGVVREGGGVQDDGVDGVRRVKAVVGIGIGVSAVAGGGMDAVDQRALVVGLEVRDLQVQSLGVGVDEGGDYLWEGSRAVDGGLAGAEEVEVRAIE